MDTLKQLIAAILSYEFNANIALLEKAYQFSQQAHNSQFRDTGEPFFKHPIEVAKILIERKADLSCIIAALLHDTVEDSAVTLKQIEDNFGDEVRLLVDGVTKLFDHEVVSEKTRRQENLQKLFLAISSDFRVLLIKLADRLHNMRTLHFLKDVGRRKRIANETLEVYVPLAEKIGFFHEELEDLAFQALDSEARASIKNKLEKRKQDQNFSEMLFFLKKIVIQGQVSGREKTLCSIWEKMRLEEILFEEVPDIFAYRIIVDSVAGCYRVLDCLCNKFSENSIIDHISSPKKNHYQALHFVIKKPHLISVQIQTNEMELNAEKGSAAHWLYKFEINNQIDLGNKIREKILFSFQKM